MLKAFGGFTSADMNRRRRALLNVESTRHMIASDAVLESLQLLSAACDPPPWIAMVEGRDHLAGDSFVMVGKADRRGEDLFFSNHDATMDEGLLDFVAAARNSIDALIHDVRTVREGGVSAHRVADTTLAQLERQLTLVDPPPWHTLMAREESRPRRKVLRTGGGKLVSVSRYLDSAALRASDGALIELIAEMRNWLPSLVAEIRESRRGL